MTDDDHADESTTADRSEHAVGTDGAGGTPDGWIESRVPSDADTADCPYCGRPFARERHRDLHRGQAHPDRLTDTEIAAYRTAVESEWDDLRRFRLLALGALVALYFGFPLAFALV